VFRIVPFIFFLFLWDLFLSTVDGFSTGFSALTLNSPEPHSSVLYSMADKAGNTAFLQKLDPESLEFFNGLTAQPFSKQAVQFLNAYWAEVGVCV
jgi:hypothetical protein